MYDNLRASWISLSNNTEAGEIAAAVLEVSRDGVVSRSREYLCIDQRDECVVEVIHGKV